jgi:hypothetical protein
MSVEKKRIRRQKIVFYTEQDIHEFLKKFFSTKSDGRSFRGIKMPVYKQGEKVRIMMFPDSAYWVHENVFYHAEVEDGEVITDTTRPVDTSTLTKEEMERMLTILDNLKKEETDESDGSGNSHV